MTDQPVHDDVDVPERRETATEGPLTAVERQVLEFARLVWKHQGAKETAVMDWFGWTLTRYNAVLLALLDRPEALAYDPMTVNRHRRLRDRRQTVRRFGTVAAGEATVKDTRGTRPMWL